MDRSTVWSIASFVCVIASVASWGQATTQQINGRVGEEDLRPVQTAVPFLTIAPDPRASALGDQGVSTSPDEYSVYWNPAKLSLLKRQVGGSIAYTPWLRALVQDMSLSHINAYYKLTQNDAVALSFTYFDLGKIQFTDINGNQTGDYNPREYTPALSYSRRLAKSLSAGLSIRYIESNLAGEYTFSSGGQARPGRTAAADLGMYWNRNFHIVDQEIKYALGLSISNIGGKISYTSNQRADYIPTLMRLGSTVSTELDDFNKFGLSLEFSKLLTPSQVINTTQQNSSVSSQNLYTPEKGTIEAMYTSFYDAPFGMREELQEVTVAVGAEYWYDNMFAVRAGYFNEAEIKGNRQLISLGVGVRYNFAGIDFSYLVATRRNHPLNNTLRFALTFNFDTEPEARKPTEE